MLFTYVVVCEKVILIFKITFHLTIYIYPIDILINVTMVDLTILYFFLAEGVDKVLQFDFSYIH